MERKPCASRSYANHDDDDTYDAHDEVIDAADSSGNRIILLDSFSNRHRSLGILSYF